MALISFNELTKFAPRLVNLYYHNTRVEAFSEPMSVVCEAGAGRSENGNLERRERAYVREWRERGGRLRRWGREECGPMRAARPLPTTSGAAPRLCRNPSDGRCGCACTAQLYAGFPPTKYNILFVPMVLSVKRPHHYDESP